MTKIKKYEVT